MRKKQLTPLEKRILNLSTRIIRAQNPIHVLDAIKWDDNIKNKFFKNKFKVMPAINAHYYKKQHLGFDPRKQLQLFYDIEHDINRFLGKYSAISYLMQERCREYRDVMHLLDARGTARFSEISKVLYGSACDAFYPGAPTLKDLSKTIAGALKNIHQNIEDKKDITQYSLKEAIQRLRQKLLLYFGKNRPIQVKATDRIVADAAAGADVIKLRRHQQFSERLIQLYEVHEGWVHVGTTINGLDQPICQFLSKGPPSAMSLQEGLAMLTEIMTFSSFPSRVQRLNNRIIAITMAEEGANFIEVFNFFRDQGFSENSSYYDTVRVFRGSQPTLGPFTKDLAYSKGFVLLYNYILLSIQKGNLSHISLLFAGKLNLDNLHLLAELLEDGILTPPKYIPPQFRNLPALSAWASYSLFLNELNLKVLAKDYRNIL